MVQVRYGGKNGTSLTLYDSESMLAVRTHARRRSVATAAPESGVPLSDQARAVLREFERVWTVPEAGVEVLRNPGPPARAEALRNDARGILKQEPAIRFAGRVLVDDAGQPALYTENFFVKFDPEEDTDRCVSLLSEYGLSVKRQLTFARNAWFVEAPEGTGQQIFEMAISLLDRPEVQLCHPELIRPIRRRGAFPQQWHLASTTINGRAVNAHANVVNAWSITRGEGTTIAVIDSGIDIGHDEFSSSGKIVKKRDVTSGDDDPRPVFSNEEHGTACAGVACGDGNFGASGVAPRARLMPIRYFEDLGGVHEAEAFEWAARNGADVISCSWGPEDNAGPGPLPDSTRLAFEFAIANGRNGKGCVILFAAGNGNESVDIDGYASYPKVIAVAACNSRGRRSGYSDFGDAIWCAFPSNDFNDPLTPGIWTADISGKRGYNPGSPHPEGDTAGNYTNSFGGTSSSCPGTAGVVALMLSANPQLRWDEVKDILRRTSDRIDPANGQYDAAGHSRFFGFGRVNALKAVQAALPLPIANHVSRRTNPDAHISDFNTTTAVLHVSDRLPIKNIRATIDIEHTFIGDLTLTLQPPNGAGGPILLHAREGGSEHNIKKTYDFVSTPALEGLKGKVIDGDWTLTITDAAAQDEGVLKTFGLEIDF
ncbi:MAG TPA: S8 family serine peptidase [Thermoanaerobaculia bacterium]|nr:S8 family serine peptidase [Thermoanaerobaculia bacterium]